MPKGFTKKQKTSAATTILFTIKSVFYPALQSYRDYLKYELLLDARNQIALNALPIGKACYQNLIERHTRLRKSPQEIHAEGLHEVARIHAEMRKLIKAHTDMTDEKAYFAALTRNPSQYLTSADALIAHNKELVQRALKELPGPGGNL